MSRLGARLARLAKVAGAVGVTAAAGGMAGSGAQSRWYVDLDKPAFQPPDVAFPVAWTALYTDLVLTAGHALDRLDTAGATEEAARYRRALALNLVLNGTWSWVFFRLHRLGPATVHAGVLTLSSADLVRRTARVSTPAGVALAPYPAWCAFATVLSATLARRNR